MGFPRVVPLLITSWRWRRGPIYVVVTYRHSPPRAKEVLIKISTWFPASSCFALVSVYAFDMLGGGATLSLQLHDHGSCRPPHHPIANWRFLKHNPNYRKSASAATTRRRLAIGEIKNSL